MTDAVNRHALRMNALCFGALIAAGFAAWTLSEYALGFHSTRAHLAQYTDAAVLAFPMVGLWLGMRRASRLREHFMFRHALLAGWQVTLVAAILCAAFTALYVTLIHPEGWQYLAEMTKARLLGQGLDAVAIKRVLRELEDASRPGPRVVQTFLLGMASGAIISFIYALVLKRKSTRPVH